MFSIQGKRSTNLFFAVDVDIRTRDQGQWTLLVLVVRNLKKGGREKMELV